MASSVIGNLRVNLGLDSASFQGGMAAAGKSMAGMKQRFQDFGNSAMQVGQALTIASAGIAAIGSAAGLLVINTANAASELTKQAQLANTSTEQFQRMASAARTVGIENDKLSDILKDVNDRVGDFLSTGGGEMADFFENVAPKVGVTAEMFRGLSGPDAMQLYVSTLEKAGLNQQEMTFYMEAMADEATALIPLLANNGAEMNRLGDAAADAGGIMSTESIAAAKEFKASLDLLKAALSGAQTAIAIELLPAATQLVEWITANGIPALRSLGETLGRIIGWFQGLPEPIQRAAAALTAAFAVGGPVLIGVGAFALAIGAIGLPLVAVTAGIATLTAGVALFWPEVKAAADSVITFATNLKDNLLGLVDQVVDIFAQLPARMAEVGRQILDGLWQGIVQKRDEVVASITGVATGIIDAAKDKLGIRSPSRVFAEIGQFLMQGLGIGIRSNAGEATAAMQGVTDQLTGAAGSPMADTFDLIRTSSKAAFTSMITGSKSAKEALNGLAMSISGGIADKLIGTGVDSLFNYFMPASNANGTRNFAGGWTNIHERGEEMAFLPSGSQIIPAGLSKRMADTGAMGGGAMRVEVGIDPRNGNVTGYVRNEAGRMDGQMARAQSRALPSQVADNQRRRIT